MAGIGLYGVYYAKCTLTNGVITGYGDVKTMGKAISATFEPQESNDNVLYANNGIAERDAAGGSGGSLTVTVDQLEDGAMADLFGLTSSSTVVSGVTGTGFDFTGNELSAPVGVAFIKSEQKDNVRDRHTAVIFAYTLFSPSSDNYATLGESVEWQTQELSGTVSGPSVCGSYPWQVRKTFPTQAAAEAFINAFFG